MKIQINSLEALERLIGGDSELEIEIRNSIVQEFTKKHLKNLIDDSFLLNFKKEVSQIINKEYFADKTLSWFNSSDKVLNLQGENKLIKLVDELVNEKFSELIRDKIQRKNHQEHIELMINQAAENITKQLAPAMLEREIDRRVQKKLRETLNID